ncbi:MAG: hypothetical protein OXC47_02120 [Cyanobacteria bacterium MAG APA_bin_95]|nr:hypothetical protein [Cyanobacteria bacterium MAG APA_bin_95]
MACPEFTGSGFCLPRLLPRQEVAFAFDPGAGRVARPWRATAGATPPTGACCADPDRAFNKAAFARASPLAVRQILNFVPLVWAMALSLRRTVLRRATLRDDGGAA